MLKEHILPRIQGILPDRAQPPMPASEAAPVPGLSASPPVPSTDHVHFKHNRMYTHNILRVNYTTYDVRRAQDTINPKTSHCDALFLAEDGNNPDELHRHPFLYGRILGIYHVNVVYSGPGALDYSPRRVEFLWVRWFEHIAPVGSWASFTLDRVSFPPMSADGAFSFVDPADVVRGCHIIPAFATGLCYPSPGNAAKLAIRSVRAIKTRNSEDWKEYRINR